MRHYRRIAAMVCCFCCMIGVTATAGALVNAPVPTEADSSAEKKTAPLLRLGGYIGGVFGSHNANFKKMSDSGFCCPNEFGSQSSFGFAFGALVEFPLKGNVMLSLRPSLWIQQPTFSQSQPTIFNNPIDNGPENGSFSYTVSPSLAAVSLDVLGAYRIGPALSLYLGPRISYLFKGTFDQLEKVETPGYVFTDNMSSERNKISTMPIPGMSTMSVAALIGAGYEIPLNRNRNYFLTPELFFMYGINSFSSGLKGGAESWTMNGFLFNIAMKYSPTNNPVREDTVIRIVESPCAPCQERQLVAGERTCVDTVVCDLPKVLNRERCECELRDNIVRIDSIVGVKSDGSRIRMGRSANKQGIVVESFQRITMKPLLPYVFFREGSALYASGYELIQTVGEAEQRVKEAKKDPQKIYHNILNIIGLRMKEDTSAIITLRGTTDGIEGDSTSNLALERAKLVRQYLVGRFNLPLSAVVVDTSRTGLPERKAMVAGRTDHESARAENRRVEIYSNVPSITAPFEFKDEIRTLSPTSIEYYLTAYTRRQATQIIMELDAERSNGGNIRLDRQQRDLDGNNSPRQMLSFKTSSDNMREKMASNVNYVLLNKASKIATVEQPVPILAQPEDVIPVRHLSVSEKEAVRQRDTLVNVYELILFDFDSDRLSAVNQKTIDKINAEIQEGAVAIVEGNTDNSGTPDNNMKLSLRRAQSVANALMSLDYKRKHIQANGAEKPLMKNDSPEGRNYNRNVIVTIKTPIRK